MRQLNYPPSCFDRWIFFDHFSSPRGGMWRMKPLNITAFSLSTYVASRQSFYGGDSFPGATTPSLSKESSDTLSCRLAPLTTSDRGTPFSSTSKYRFVPFFSPIRRVWADGIFREWCLDARPVGRLPEPGDTLQGGVFCQPASSYAAK